MPPKDIVRDIRMLIKTNLIPVVPEYWHIQFDFGLKAFGLRSFSSANGNARKVVANPYTAGTKTDRLLANVKLAEYFGRIFDTLRLVHKNSFVNIDHSDCNGLMALVGAVQTRKGRAIPCLVETTYSDRLPADQNAPPRKRKLRAARAKERQQLSLTIHTIRSLKRFAKRLGFWPKLVFDRGFGSQAIITLLCRKKATFYIRLKAGRFVEFASEQVKAKDLLGKDNTITLFGYQLRVVKSRKPGKLKETWYILTNDHESTTKKILKVYRHRFEIEETFKDIKHIFELKRTRLNKPNSLKVILWLVSLGIALLYIVIRETIQSERWQNPKKWRSWLRKAWEQLEREITILAWGDPPEVVGSVGEG